MEFTVLEQTISFLYSSLTGFTVGFIYDFIRCVKKTFFKNKIIWDILDVIFVLTCAVFLIFAFYAICGLSFRFYHILGLVLGGIIYFTSINRVVYKIFEKILIIFKEILKILLYPVKIFSKIISGFFCFIVKLIKIPYKYLKCFFIKFILNVKNITKRKKKV